MGQDPDFEGHGWQYPDESSNESGICCYWDQSCFWCFTVFPSSFKIKRIRIDITSWRVLMIMSVFVCRLLWCHSLSSVDRTGSWFCLRRLSTPAHLLKRSRLSWLIHLCSWLLPRRLPQRLLFLLLLYSQARVKPRKNWRTQIGIWIWYLWLILSKQPTQAAWFEKHGNKVSLLLKGRGKKSS